MVSDAENFKDDAEVKEFNDKQFLQFKVPLCSSTRASSSCWRPPAPPRPRSTMVRMTVSAPMVATVDLIALLDILWC